MPELPEVEVTRRGFAAGIRGGRILHARVDPGLRWPLGLAADRLVGTTVGGVDRRGKYLILELDRGLLLIHLGMSGSLSFRPVQPPPGVHDHMDLVTDRGQLRLHDPRRFGAVVWAPGLESPRAQKLLSELGVEPLGDAFDVRSFHAALKSHHAAIKPVLLSGRVVVGLGNIYASEVLFRAGIRPTVRADRLSLARVERLHAAIRTVLSHAIERGGSTLRDFCGSTGEAGHFLLDAAVYGRAGLPCPVCGTPIKHIRQGQRSSYFCPSCQRF